jgi:hypothetical protein
MPVTHTKVSTVADGSTTEHVRPSDWNANHTLTAPVTFPVGSSSTAPIVIQSGTLLTVASSGAVEADVNCLYYTANSSGRGVIPAVQFITQTTALAGSTVLTAIPMFDASTGLGGAVNVGPSQAYLFKTDFLITGRSSSSHTINFGFSGTATITRQSWHSIAHSQNAVNGSTLPTAALQVHSTGVNPIILATTHPFCQAHITGKVVVGTSGTLIPSITRTAGTVALVTAADSYFYIWPIGSDAVNRTGHWS